MLCGHLGWCSASTEARRRRRAAATARRVRRGCLGRRRRRCSATPREFSVSQAARHPLRLLERRTGAGALFRPPTTTIRRRLPPGIHSSRPGQGGRQRGAPGRVLRYLIRSGLKKMLEGLLALRPPKVDSLVGRRIWVGSNRPTDLLKLNFIKNQSAGPGLVAGVGYLRHGGAHAVLLGPRPARSGSPPWQRLSYRLSVQLEWLACVRLLRWLATADTTCCIRHSTRLVILINPMHPT